MPLDPTKAHASARLWRSNYQLDSAIGSYTPVLGDLGRTTGKWYFEVICVSTQVVAGIATSTFRWDLSVIPGNTGTNSQWSAGVLLQSGRFYRNLPGEVTSPTLASWGGNDVAGFAVDLDSKTLHVYKNNVLWGSSATGALGSHEYFPVVATFTGANQASLMDGGEGEMSLSYPPPAGYQLWNKKTVTGAIYQAKTFWSTTTSGLCVTGNPTASTRLAAARPGRRSGKWYFEVYIDAEQSTDPIMGVITARHLNNTNLGNSNQSWAVLSTGSRIHNTSSAAFGLANPVTMDTVGFALDLDTGKIWAAVNNVWVGDPVAGTNPMYSNLPVNTITVYPAMTSNNTGSKATFRLRQEHFKYAPPSGYAAIEQPEFKVSGVALVNGVPGSVLLRAFYKDSGNFAGEALPDAQGNYTVKVLDPLPVHVMALYEDRAEAHGPVTPIPIS